MSVINLRGKLWQTFMALAVCAAPCAGWSEEALKVIKLRTERVALLDCKDGSKKAEFMRDKFKEPWPVARAAQPGLLQVQVDGQQYCVRAYTVETNKTITANAECGAVVAAKEPKSAATRGLGEECKP